MSVLDLLTGAGHLEEWSEHKHQQTGLTSGVFDAKKHKKNKGRLSTSFWLYLLMTILILSGQLSPFKKARSDSSSAFCIWVDILALIPGAKNSEQSARQRRGLSAVRHRSLPYHINDVGLLSSSLDYGHLLNYFLEINLFFNLGQMAIWPTVTAHPSPPCGGLLRQMLNRVRPAD